MSAEEIQLPPGFTPAGPGAAAGLGGQDMKRQEQVRAPHTAYTFLRVCGIGAEGLVLSDA